MDNYQTSEVYNYLRNLESYLNGDLKIFHQICITAEQQLSSTTGLESTKYPDKTESHSSPSESNSQGASRLTIPIVLTLFATIDIVGYLSGGNKDYQETEKNFKEFFKRSSIAVTNTDCELLVNAFRHGMAHAYFPKLSLGISYHSRNPSGELFFNDGTTKVVLNINRLEKIVIDAIKDIQQNGELYSQMEQRYEGLIASYKKSLNLLLKN